MNTSADRLSGAFMLLFGLAAYFAIIPASVEPVDSGNIAPDTMPNALSWVIAAGGLLLMLKPSAQPLPPLRHLLQVGLIVLVLGVAIAAMSFFGFVHVAPLLALIIMGLIGERRPRWLLTGAAGVPMLIWFLVVHVLDRVLP